MGDLGIAACMWFLEFHFDVHVSNQLLPSNKSQSRPHRAFQQHTNLKGNQRERHRRCNLRSIVSLVKSATGGLGQEQQY